MWWWSLTYWFSTNSLWLIHKHCMYTTIDPVTFSIIRCHQRVLLLDKIQKRGRKRLQAHCFLPLWCGSVLSIWEPSGRPHWYSGDRWLQQFLWKWTSVHQWPDWVGCSNCSNTAGGLEILWDISRTSSRTWEPSCGWWGPQWWFFFLEGVSGLGTMVDGQARIKDYNGVVQELASKAQNDKQLFMATRRKATFSRVNSLWQRQATKSDATKVLWAHYSGESGIDSGAIALEFLERASKIWDKSSSQMEHLSLPIPCTGNCRQHSKKLTWWTLEKNI